MHYGFSPRGEVILFYTRKVDGRQLAVALPGTPHQRPEGQSTLELVRTHFVPTFHHSDYPVVFAVPKRGRPVSMGAYAFVPPSVNDCAHFRIHRVYLDGGECVWWLHMPKCATRLLWQYTQPARTRLGFSFLPRTRTGF